MATEKILIFDEAGNAKRMKVRIARFLDNEPVTASDKTNIRTTLDVDDSLSGTFTTPLSVTSASDSSFTGGGNVGIGTASPNVLLHCDSGGNTAANLKLEANRTGADAAVGQIAADWDGTTVAKIALKSGSDTTNKDDGEIVFETATAGSTAERWRINSSGSLVSGASEQPIDLTGNGILQAANNLYLRSTGSSPIIFQNGSATRWTIDTSGNFVSSGGGIDFGSTTTGTGTPSGGLLDDFESGSFTPSLEFGGAATGMTFSNRSGYYTKVGNLVSAQVLIVLSAKGSSTGNATITGLPFTTAGTNGARECSAVYSFSMSGLNSLPMAVTDLSATLATLYESGASGRGNLTDANFTNSSGLVLRLTYEA